MSQRPVRLHQGVRRKDVFLPLVGALVVVVGVLGLGEALGLDVGLRSLLAIVAVLAATGVLVAQVRRGRRRQAELPEAGEPGRAHLVSVRQIAMSTHRDSVMVELVARIEVEGWPPYEGLSTETVQADRQARLQPGVCLKVFVDPKDQAHVSWDLDTALHQRD